MSCTVSFLSKADQVSGTFSDWGQRPSWALTCTRAGSPSKMQLKASKAKLGVIFVPVKHSALYQRPSPLALGLAMLPPEWQALL